MKKILVVDDQSFNINAVTNILKSYFNIDPSQYCDYAFNGLEAVNKVKTVVH